MAKKNSKGEVHFLGKVKQELAPLLDSEYEPQVYLHLFPHHEAFSTPSIYFQKIGTVCRHLHLYACIEFKPYPLDDRKRYRIEVGALMAPAWTSEADTAEQAVEVANTNLKRLVSEARAARRAAQAAYLAKYNRRQAEASA